MADSDYLPNSTLTETADRWLRKKKNDGCAESTMAGYHSRVNLYIRQRNIGEVKLSWLRATGEVR